MLAPRERLSDKRDRLKQLRAFCCAARLESISRAAERLDVTQTAVSTRVRDLEHELEAELFDRSGQRISRNSAGEIFYRLVAPLLDEVDELLHKFSQRLEMPISGELRIGASQCTATSMLPAHLKHYHGLFPEIRLHVRRCATEEGADLLLADEVDVLFGPQSLARSDETRDKLVFHPLYFYDYVLVTPLDHPLAGRDLVTEEDVAAYPMIRRSAGTHGSRPAAPAVQAPGSEPNVALYIESWNTTKRHVEAGLGIAVVPSACINDGDRLEIIPLTQHFKRQTGGIFSRRGRPLSGAAEQLLALLEERFADGTSPQGRSAP